MAYDVVTVVYEEEVELLALQARSIDLLGRRLTINRIYVIANGAAQKRTIRRINSEVLPGYGARRSQVEIVPASDLMRLSEAPCGWHSQQVLKLAVARRIGAGVYVTLDAKNHLVRDSDDGILFDPAGVPYFHPASLRGHRMAVHYNRCAEICGIDGDRYVDRCFPSITPAVLYRDHVAGLLEFLPEHCGTTLESMLCRDFAPVTEYMMYDCYLRRLNVFDRLYAPGPRLVITLWTSQVDDNAQFEQLMGEAETGAAPFFSVHREARGRLSREQSARIAAFWQRIGLVRSEREANAYLAPARVERQGMARCSGGPSFSEAVRRRLQRMGAATRLLCGPGGGRERPTRH